METHFTWCIFAMTIHLGVATPYLAMSTLVFPPLGVEIALIAKIYFFKTFSHNFYSFSKSWLFMPYPSCLMQFATLETIRFPNSLGSLTFHSILNYGTRTLRR